MKKVFITLFCITLLMSSVSIGHCDSWLTGELCNGHFIVDCFEKGAVSQEWGVAFHYILGVLQTIVYTKQSNKFVGPKYEKYTSAGLVFSDLYLYYKNNPTQLSKPVIQVLLEDAK